MGAHIQGEHLVSEVLGNERVADGFYLLKLAAPSIAARCEPGQFVLVRGLVAAWPYLRRPFSIYSSDGEAIIEIVYRVVGRATRAMRDMTEGDRFDVIGPLGTSFSPPQGRAVGVAGGIGLPPIAYFCQRYAGFADGLTIIVGARSKHQLLVPVNLLVGGVEMVTVTEDGSRGMRGTAIDALRKVLETHTPSQIVACGPVEMLRRVAEISRERSIRCEVSIEERMGCGIGVCLGCAVPASGGGYLHACCDGPVLPAEAIAWQKWCGK